MLVHGARTTDGAFQTAATPRKSNAWLRCGVLGEDADPIRSPGRPTGPPPGAGIPPTRSGAIGAPIRPIFATGAAKACVPLDDSTSQRASFARNRCPQGGPATHSITSSAISRNSRETVRPSCLAVFRLRTSSNVVGCCTGNSAGLAPLRIFSR